MNDREHIIFNGLLLVGLLYILNHFSISLSFEYIILLVLGYLVGTVWLTPDLDTHSRARKRWLFLMPFWWIFDKLIHHRTITHRPVVGTFVLLLYLAFTIVLIVLVMSTLGLISNDTIQKTLVFMVKYPTELGWIILGMVLGNLGHLVGDKITKN